MCPGTFQNIFSPDPTWFKMSPQQQESFVSLPDLHLENVSPLKKKERKKESHWAWLVLYLGQEQNKTKQKMDLQHSFVARKQGCFYSPKDSARRIKKVLKGFS